MRDSTHKSLLILVFGFLLVVGIVFLLRGDREYVLPTPFDQTEEEHEEQYSDWLTHADTEQGISFRYPETLSTKYITTLDWPPQVQVVEEPYSCTEAGEEHARAGKTEKRIVDAGREYCRTTVVEGAAGSIYTQYAYAFPRYTQDSEGVSPLHSSTVILAFSTRASQCGNYDETQRKACEGERETFDLDRVVDAIAQSFTIASSASGTSGESHGQGITGITLLGPTCPVERIPPDPACAPKPYKTSLVITTVDQAQVIKTVSTGEDGTFRIDLLPGEYAIRSAAAANMLPYCSSEGTIIVKSNTYTKTTVHCDTGIR